MKFKTVFEGEKAILVDRNGESKIIEGPKRVFLFMEKLEKLHQYVADSNQYLVIKYIDGNVVHKKGPVAEWFNRFEHESISVENGYKLNSSQLIIVYNQNLKTNQVVRRVIEGPCLFIPDASEWLHQFKWHSPDSNNLGHLVKDGNEFRILTNKPDFFHYYVNEVRTLDDTLMTIKIMIIYELVDIFTMLDKTQDPISDFANAICADVVSAVGKLSFEEFLRTGASRLNSLETYKELTNRASRNGYKIESIIYNGYTSSKELQSIQDNAIEQRTKLRLNAEIDEQKNKLIDLRLKKENERLDLEANLKRLKFEFEQTLVESRSKFELLLRKLKNESNLKMKQLDQDLINELRVKNQQAEQDYLNKLSALGVDVNTYELELVKSKHKLDTLYELIN